MTFYNQIESNIRKTWFFITLFLVLIIVLGWIFSNIFDSNWILIFAVAYSVIWSFLSYWYSDKIILSLNKAHSVSKNEEPELYRIVENLAITAGLPMPKIYIMEEESPNAFATGRNPQNSVICVTRGLLSILDKPELEGVIAHEFSHIGNRDILLSSVIVVLVGMISLLGNWFFRGMRFGVGGSQGGDDNDSGGGIIFLVAGLLTAILAPIAASLLQLAISRKREFLADSSGVLMTRYPEGLAQALEKISQYPKSLNLVFDATRSLFIADPMKKEKNNWFSRLWLTHPPVEERVKKLREMSLA